MIGQWPTVSPMVRVPSLATEQMPASAVVAKENLTVFGAVTVGGFKVGAADLDWESSSAHSAVYDAEKTAAIFCEVMNRWEMQA